MSKGSKVASPRVLPVKCCGLQSWGPSTCVNTSFRCWFVFTWVRNVPLHGCKKHLITCEKHPITCEKHSVRHVSNVSLHVRNVLLHIRNILLHVRNVPLPVRNVPLHVRNVPLHVNAVVVMGSQLLTKREVEAEGCFNYIL